MNKRKRINFSHSYSQWIEIDEIGTCKCFMSRHQQHVYYFDDDWKKSSYI